MDWSTFSLSDWNAFSLNDWATFLLDPANTWRLAAADVYVPTATAGQVFNQCAERQIFNQVSAGQVTV